MATTKQANRKPTTAEKKAAFDMQSPTGKGKGNGSKVPTVFNFDSFKEARKQYRQYDDEPNWIPSENLLGQAFFIVDAFGFESGEYGSKAAFKIKFDVKSDDVAMFSLSWNAERDEMIKTVKALRRKNGKDTSIGPVTLILIEGENGMNPYRKIVGYTDAIGAEYAERGKREKPARKRSTKKAAKAKPAKDANDIGI